MRNTDVQKYAELFQERNGRSRLHLNMIEEFKAIQSAKLVRRESFVAVLSYKIAAPCKIMSSFQQLDFSKTIEKVKML